MQIQCSQKAHCDVFDVSFVHLYKKEVLVKKFKRENEIKIGKQENKTLSVSKRKNQLRRRAPLRNIFTINKNYFNV